MQKIDTLYCYEAMARSAVPEAIAHNESYLLQES
ncbi:hypothetical protein NIES3585_40750 [Nodularia sp. NIES-3585]|nr:hypothetical protein NIES3585_40750 [Nodularia sp. NIES-3585]